MNFHCLCWKLGESIEPELAMLAFRSHILRPSLRRIQTKGVIKQQKRAGGTLRHVIGMVWRIIYVTQDFTLQGTAVVDPTAREIRPWRFQHLVDSPTSSCFLYIPNLYRLWLKKGKKK
jgi:hypothetical protein